MAATTPPNRDQILKSISNLRNQLVADLASLNTSSPDFSTASRLQGQLDNTLGSAFTAVSLISPGADAAALTVWSNWFENITDPNTPNLKDFATIISTDVPTPANQLGQCTYPTSNGGTVTTCMTEAECDALVGSSFSAGGC